MSMQIQHQPGALQEASYAVRDEGQERVLSHSAQPSSPSFYTKITNVPHVYVDRHKIKRQS